MRGKLDVDKVPEGIHLFRPYIDASDHDACRVIVASFRLSGIP